MTAEERFRAKVARAADGCWLWTASTNKDGYAIFWSGQYRFLKPKRSPIMVLAHRWAYEHFVGSVPDELCVLHTCDTPACVNPDHLFLGTQADNVRDCEQKGRRNQRRDKKLTADLRTEIRRRYTGQMGEQTALAREYGVGQTTISKIVGGRARERCSV